MKTIPSAYPERHIHFRFDGRFKTMSVVWNVAWAWRCTCIASCGSCILFVAVIIHTTFPITTVVWNVTWTQKSTPRCLVMSSLFARPLLGASICIDNSNRGVCFSRSMYILAILSLLTRQYIRGVPQGSVLSPPNTSLKYVWGDGAAHKLRQWRWGAGDEI